MTLLTTKYKAYFASKGEVGVTEEADSDDRSAEQLRGVDVGHDAAAGHVVVDHSGVDPASPHHPGLLYGPDDQLSDPVRDVVHLSSGVELLITRPPLRQLTAVGVALSKEVFGPEIIFFVCNKILTNDSPQGGPVHSAAFELAPLGLRHDVINIPLDDRGRGLVKKPLSVHTLKNLLSVTVLLLHSRSMLSLPPCPCIFITTIYTYCCIVQLE